MKQLIILWGTIILCCGCTAEKNTLIPTGEPHVEGNDCYRFDAPASRSTQSLDALPTDTPISFFAQGGLEATDVHLTYNGTQWRGDLPRRWNHQEKTTQIAAYYPALPENPASLYNDKGHLTDVCYDQKEIATGSTIRLQFKHLFARISFHVDARLNATLKAIRFKPSRRVTRILPHTAAVETEKNEETWLTFEQEENGTYTFILPPAPSIDIDIELTDIQGSTKHARLAAQTIQSGIAYRCRLREHGSGISTADEFIAFTKLMNGKVYKDYTLEQFQSVESDAITYYLNNDIFFTEDESKQVEPIQRFGDTFDGQGFVLRNLQINTPTSSKTYGLFMDVSATGCIQNLKLRHVNLNLTKSTYMGALVGVNYGIISNCHIDSLNITSNTESGRNIGGIAYANRGILINSSLRSCILLKSMKTGISFGGITNYNNEGILLNCHVSNIHFKKSHITNAGLICNQIKDGVMQNCYIYDYTSNSNINAILRTIATSSTTHTIKSCYYATGDAYYPIDNTAFKQAETLAKHRILTYRTSTMLLTEGTPLAECLNAWIDDEGRTQYPHLSFHRWKHYAGEKPPVVFVHP